MLLSYQIETPPSVEPVRLAELKAHLRIDPGLTADDGILSMYLIAARQYAEKYTRRAFLPQTWVLSLDHFPLWRFGTTLNPEMRHDWPYFGTAWDYLAIRLPKPRCISIVSVTYLDLFQNLQAIDPSEYYVDMTSEPARLVPIAGSLWPYTQQYLPGSINVTFTCGTYAEPYLVPNPIKLAIMLLAGSWYAHSESTTEGQLNTIPFGVECLLDLYAFNVMTYEAN